MAINATNFMPVDCSWLIVDCSWLIVDCWQVDC